ncbi:MAG: hypothetical protein M1826_006096 [Phylliscum demangeonii]|nr:MAG: hypothetical protein M1826_006096 [Phylliscum demangeonii]
MRKGVGLGAFDRRSLTSAQYASHGQTVRAEHLSSLETQLSVFQSVLQQFAITHGKEIRSNPTFRAEFARMCNAIGVDPLLASSSGSGGSTEGGKKEGRAGSFWAQILGSTVNDFYFELAVKVVETCRATRDVNGGLMPVAECRDRIVADRRRAGAGEVQISEYVSFARVPVGDDVLCAVRALAPLGSGFSIVSIGQEAMIRSVPKELNTDQSTVLEAMHVLGYVTLSMLQANLGWEPARAQTVLDDLLADSLVWIDTQAVEPEYWTPMHIQDNGG